MIGLALLERAHTAVLKYDCDYPDAPELRRRWQAWWRFLGMWT